MSTLTPHVKHISALPPLPDTLESIQKAAHDPLASFKEIADAVQKDPFLSANILKLANASVYGFKEPITTLQQAISMFGISTVVGYAMTQAIQNTLSVDFAPYHITPSQFLEHATAQNAVAFRWKRGLNSEENDVYMTASFLMEVGSLLIADYLIRENLVTAFQQALENGTSLIEAEKELCGFNHHTIGAAMFEEWGFSPSIVRVIRESGSAQAADPIAKRLFIISQAINLKEQLSEISIQNSLQKAEELGFDTQELSVIYRQMGV